MDDQSLVDGLGHELGGAGSLRTPPGTASAILSAIDSALGAIDPAHEDEARPSRRRARPAHIGRPLIFPGAVARGAAEAGGISPVFIGDRRL